METPNGQPHGPHSTQSQSVSGTCWPSMVADRVMAAISAPHGPDQHGVLLAVALHDEAQVLPAGMHVAGLAVIGAVQPDVLVVATGAQGCDHASRLSLLWGHAHGVPSSSLARLIVSTCSSPAYSSPRSSSGLLTSSGVRFQ